MNANEYFKQGSGTVALCGSTRFFFECMQVNRMLTFENWIVLQCGSWGHSFHKFINNEPRTPEETTLVKRLHLHKILMSDCIVVVSDASAYIGESTDIEIRFAKWHHKPVFYSDGFDLRGPDIRPCNVPNRFPTDWGIIDETLDGLYDKR